MKAQIHHDLSPNATWQIKKGTSINEGRSRRWGIERDSALESHNRYHNGVTWCSLDPPPRPPPGSVEPLIPICYNHETRASPDVMRRTPCQVPVKLFLELAASSASARAPPNHSRLKEGERSAVETTRA